jgi:hypothetical protein
MADDEPDPFKDCFTPAPKPAAPKLHNSDTPISSNSRRIINKLMACSPKPGTAPYVRFVEEVATLPAEHRKRYHRVMAAFEIETTRAAGKF